MPRVTGRPEFVPRSRQRAVDLPNVHARGADDDIADIIEDEMGKGGFSGVLHCFQLRLNWQGAPLMSVSM